MTIRARRFLILLLFINSTGFAAEGYVISLKGLQVTGALAGYYIDKVINATAEDSCIGYVQKGMFNRQEPAYLSPSTATALEGLLKSSFPRTDTAKPLIVRINKLLVYELTWSSREIAAIELSISLITRDGSGYTELFLTGASFDKNGLDVTGFHRDNIVTAFEICFRDFNRHRDRGSLQPRKIAEADLYRNPLDHPEEFPILQKRQISRGLFPSFISFRDCRPDTTTPFEVDYTLSKKDSSYVTALLTFTPGDPKKKVYGFCDGKDLFIRVGKHYNRVKRKAKWISVRVEKGDLSQNDYADGAFMAGYMFGAIGGLMAGLANGIASQEKTVCHLSFVNGHLAPSRIPDYMKIESNTYLGLPNDVREPVSVIHGKDTVCILKPGTCLKLELPTRFAEVTLVFSARNAETKTWTFIPHLFNTDVYLVRVKRNGTITAETAYEAVRENILENTPRENLIVRKNLLPQPVSDKALK